MRQAWALILIEHCLPWDLGAPQPAIVGVAHLFKGDVLDVGCGLGDNAIFLSTLPEVSSVTGIDISPIAIQQAQQRLAAAAESGPPGAVAPRVRFLEGSAFDLDSVLQVEGAPQQGTTTKEFDVLLDSTVFHCIGDDAAQRRYVAAVSPFLKPGGIVVMLAMSDENKAEPYLGPRRISPDHARALWSEAGLVVESIDKVDFIFPPEMGRGGIGPVATPVLGGEGHAILMIARKWIAT